jgi:hypothetical protein
MGLTMKSLMPIIINFRDDMMTLVDTKGREHSFVTYYMKVFKRDISVLLFFFCRMGLKSTLRYFIMDQILNVIDSADEDPTDEEHYYFTVNKNISLKVNKHFFDKYPYVKAMVGMVRECINSRATLEQMESTDFWLEQLGGLYTTTKHKKAESGRSTMLLTEAA